MDKPNITQVEMSVLLNVTPRMIRYRLSELVSRGYVKRIGSNKKGKWIIISNEGNENY